MTDQERLAQLLGKEGRRAVVHKDIMGNVISRKPEPRPVSQLIESAEKRWKNLEPGDERLVCLYSYASITHCSWYGEQRGNPLGIGTDEQFAKAHATTEQESRAKCAIAGLKRLEEQKDG